MQIEIASIHAFRWESACHKLFHCWELMNCLDVKLVASFLNFPPLSACTSVSQRSNSQLCKVFVLAQEEACVHSPAKHSLLDVIHESMWTQLCTTQTSVLLHTQVCVYVQSYPDVSPSIHKCVSIFSLTQM